jgi:hypothetical protein
VARSQGPGVGTGHASPLTTGIMASVSRRRLLSAIWVLIPAALGGCSSPTGRAQETALGVTDGGVEHIDGAGKWTWSGPRTCVAGNPGTVIASFHGTMPTGSPAVDSGRLYLSMDATGDAPGVEARFDIVSVPFSCGKPSVLAERPRGGADLTYAEGKLFWLEGTGVFSMPADGGPIQALASATNGTSLAARGGYVYWTDRIGSVSKVAMTGGAVVTLASGYDRGTAIATNDDNVYWASVLPPDMDGGAQASIGRVLKVSVNGGQVTTIASEQQDPNSLLLTGTDLYWANAGTYGVDAPADPGAVLAVPLSGGSVSVVAPEEVAPHSLRLVGNTVYWMDGAAASYEWIRSLSVSTKELSTVVPQSSPVGLDGLTSSADHLYWIQWMNVDSPVSVLSMPVY